MEAGGSFMLNCLKLGYFYTGSWQWDRMNMDGTVQVGFLSQESGIHPLKAFLNLLQPGSGPQFGGKQVLDSQGHPRVTQCHC